LNINATIVILFKKKETNAGKLVFLVDAATMEVVDVDSPLVEGGEYKVHVEPEVMISLELFSHKCDVRPMFFVIVHKLLCLIFVHIFSTFIFSVSVSVCMCG
jgi:hypothetical protein